MKSKGGRGGQGGKSSPHKQQQTKRPSNNDPGTPTSKASESKRPKQVVNQHSIVKYVSTDVGSSSSGTNAIVPVADSALRKEQQQDDDDIMVIEEVPPLSPPKVSRATSEAVLTELPSECQQESPSSTQISAQASKKLSMTPMVARPTSDQAAEEESRSKQVEKSMSTQVPILKKSPATTLNSMNCVYDWSLEGATIKKESNVAIHSPSNYLPYTSYQGREEKDCIQHVLQEVVPPLLQAQQTDRKLDDKMDLRLEEYFDLFVLVFDPSYHWPKMDLLPYQDWT
jgi:hypothetical protein